MQIYWGVIKITVVIKIGRRVPRNWFKRQANRAKGLLSFQENIWIMVKQSMTMAKKKATASKKIKFIMTILKEEEDLNYELEWLKIVIQGTKEQEQEEYEDSLQMYSAFGKVLKKDMPKDDRLSKKFKTKLLSLGTLEEAYKKGYGAVSENSIANKLLEMGILTHVEWIKDFDTREVEYQPDF